MYLDNAATTKLSKNVKEYIISILDDFGNPSSQYSLGDKSRQIIEQSRLNVAKFINGNVNNIIFTSSGSSANTLVIKGLTNDNPLINEYKIFYSSTSHKSIIRACKSCLYYEPLKVNKYGEINIKYLDSVLSKNNIKKPFVCIEAANSEIGTINDVVTIADIVHKYHGLILIDATGYIPSFKVDMEFWNKIDFLTFSGHKLHALKGVGVVYKNSDVKLKPLVYGSQENGLFSGTENVLGIASLGKAVENYDYSSISSENRDCVYNYIINNITNSYLVGAPLKNRLPNNLYMCFKGIRGESLMTLLDMNDVQVSTGSACNSGDLMPSPTLTAIGINKNDIHSCIRMSFGEKLNDNELNYICNKLQECVNKLRDIL